MADNGLYHDLPHIPGGKTTAELDEPDERGWRTVLTTGLYRGHPVMAGWDVQGPTSIGERIARAFERRGVNLVLDRPGGVTVAVATRDTVIPDWLISAATAPAADGVRCPECGKKLGERLTGTIEVTCPRCKRRVTIAR